MLDRPKNLRNVILGIHSGGLSLGFAIHCLPASIELGEVFQVDNSEIDPKSLLKAFMSASVDFQ